ncbi:SMI1/KNR4 family protein [Streptomyces sp. PA03-1a]|nr:SMI1/KNR4 family protein [Streptomyces sp. PA03-1a]
MDTSSAEIEQVERALGVALPEDYRTFLAVQGAVSRFFPPADDFLQLFPAGDLIGLNEAAELAARLPGAVIIGGDGSRELLVYDVRQQHPSLYTVDVSAEGWSDAIHQASSITEFMARFSEQGRLWE